MMYKYLLVEDKNHKLIYGECILWKCGVYDLSEELNITINLPQKHVAHVIYTKEDISEFSDGCILINKKIKFDFQYVDNEFITRKYNEYLFNPFSDLCTNAKIYSSDLNKTETQQWFDKNKSLIDKLKTDFNVDLSRNPELFCSFIIYNPIRLIIVAKYNENESNGFEFSINFIDEFNSYSDAEFDLKLYSGEEVIEDVKGVVGQPPSIIKYNKKCDALMVIINKDQDKIYESMDFYIKKITVNSTVVGTSIELENGQVVNINHSENFTLGLD